MKQISVLNIFKQFKGLKRFGNSHCLLSVFCRLPDIWFWVQYLLYLVLYILGKKLNFHLAVCHLKFILDFKLHLIYNSSWFILEKQTWRWLFLINNCLGFIYVLLSLILRLHISYSCDLLYVAFISYVSLFPTAAVIIFF